MAPTTATATEAALAGAVAGGVTRLVAAPFDLIKIRFQVQQAPISSTSSSAKYVGFVQSLRSIHAEEGLISFWRGNLAASGLWISYSALQFAAYRSLVALWPDAAVQKHNTLVSVANGAGAGVMATVVTYPLDLFRTILASQGVPKQFPTLRTLVGHTLQTRGVTGFYRGMGPALFQIAPYMGLSFGVYATVNDALVAQQRRTSGEPLTGSYWLLSRIGAGAVAGLVSKLAVYPIDTIKKRMQVSTVKRCASYGVIPHYESSLACAHDILRREGVVGLYKGTWPSLLKSVVTHSCTFASYECALLALQQFREDEGEEDGAAIQAR